MPTWIEHEASSHVQWGVILAYPSAVLSFALGDMDFLSWYRTSQKLDSESSAEELQKSVPDELQRLHKARGCLGFSLTTL